MKTINQLSLVSIACLAFGVFAIGQAPVLGVGTPTQAGLGWGVQVTNSYTAPVTAYALEAGSRGEHGAGAYRLKWQDSVLSGRTLDLGLAPGQSHFENMGGGVPARGVTVLAVIYADGATAGEPAVIAHLMKARQQFLSEMPAALATLRAVSADPGADRKAVVADFQQRAAAGAAALTDSRFHSSDGVSESVVRTLQDPTNTNLQDSAYALVQLLTRWQIKLSASLPKLPSTASSAQR